jgi:hypothetical protein
MNCPWATAASIKSAFEKSLDVAITWLTMALDSTAFWNDDPV